MRAVHAVHPKTVQALIAATQGVVIPDAVIRDAATPAVVTPDAATRAVVTRGAATPDAAIQVHGAANLI